MKNIARWPQLVNRLLSHCGWSRGWHPREILILERSRWQRNPPSSHGAQPIDPGRCWTWKWIFRLIKSIEWLDQGFLFNLIYVMKVFIEEFFFYLIYLIKVFLQPFRPTDDPTLMILKLASVGDWVHIYVCHQNDQSYLIMSAHIFWRLNSYAYKKINST